MNNLVILSPFCVFSMMYRSTGEATRVFSMKNLIRTICDAVLEEEKICGTSKEANLAWSRRQNENSKSQELNMKKEKISGSESLPMTEVMPDGEEVESQVPLSKPLCPR